MCAEDLFVTGMGLLGIMFFLGIGVGVYLCKKETK